MSNRGETQRLEYVIAFLKGLNYRRTVNKNNDQLV